MDNDEARYDDTYRYCDWQRQKQYPAIFTKAPRRARTYLSASFVHRGTSIFRLESPDNSLRALRRRAMSSKHRQQDHRAIKRRTRPMLGFKNFRCARIILGGIEFMHMIVKGQMKDGGIAQTPAQQFYSLVA